MCFSAYAQYAPRPVREAGHDEPPASIATTLAGDPNIFGLLAAPTHHPEAHRTEPHHHHHEPAARAAGSTVESVIVVLPDGRRLLVTPLD